MRQSCAAGFLGGVLSDWDEDRNVGTRISSGHLEEVRLVFSVFSGLSKRSPV